MTDPIKRMDILKKSLENGHFKKVENNIIGLRINLKEDKAPETVIDTQLYLP